MTALVTPTGRPFTRSAAPPSLAGRKTSFSLEKMLTPEIRFATRLRVLPASLRICAGHCDAAARTARRVIEHVLKSAPPRALYLLNVNIPNAEHADRLPRVITRLGRRHASEPVIRQTNPRGETMYWIGAAGDAREAGEGTDFHAVANGRVSMTPLQVDLTDHAAMPEWHGWLSQRESA